MSLVIKTLSLTQIPIADNIFRMAFGSPAGRINDIERILSIQPDGYFLAFLDDEPVGSVCAVDYRNFAYIGMMAVLPRFQKRGIGKNLLQHILKWLDERGSPMSLLDASDAGFPLYRHFGFEEKDHVDQYTRQGSWSFSSLEENIRMMTPEDISLIKAFDEPIFGANRSAVIEAYFRDYPGRAFITFDPSRTISGYLIAQEQRIGPWIANNQDDARLLLMKALTLPFKTSPQIIAPRLNVSAVQLIEEFGFVLMHTQTHMGRGAINLSRQRSMICGQASYALG